MTRFFSLFIVLVLTWCNNTLFAQTTLLDFDALSVMDQSRLEKIVKEEAVESEGERGYVFFLYQNIPMAMQSDTTFDRMRIFAPIIEKDKLTPEQKDILLEANYHSALDGRYAVSEGFLMAVFIHPISPLTEEQVQSGLRQVAALVRNFGTTYSSDELSFGASADDSGQN